MANLHIFGDSYSVDWNKYFHRKGNPIGGQGEYYKRLKRKPLHFAEVIKKELKLNKIYYHAIGAADNYTILESIGKCINSIKDDDYVCIGWSDITRYRIITPPHIKNKGWLHIFIQGLTVPIRYTDDVSKAFYKQSVDRDCEFTIKEIGYWQKILMKSLPNNTIFWSPFDRNQKRYPYSILKEPFEVIADVTDIDDMHASEKGHEEIGKFLISVFKNNPYKSYEIF